MRTQLPVTTQPSSVVRVFDENWPRERAPLGILSQGQGLGGGNESRQKRRKVAGGAEEREPQEFSSGTTEVMRKRGRTALGDFFAREGRWSCGGGGEEQPAPATSRDWAHPTSEVTAVAAAAAAAVTPHDTHASTGWSVHGNGAAAAATELGSPLQARDQLARNSAPVPRKMPRVVLGQRAYTAEVNPNELSHMVHFFLCQMRAQCERLLGAATAAAFDAEMARLDPSRGSGACNRQTPRIHLCGGQNALGGAVTPLGGAGLRVADDVVAQGYLMSQFFAKAARGDKWVPWHTVLGAHERYLQKRVYSHRNLSESDRFVLMFAFSGSREMPLFDSLFQPLLWDANAGEAAALSKLRKLLHEPARALRRGGRWHRKYARYRASGRRLHTTCYTIHPPAGCAGDEFTFFIVDHTRRYIELGQRIWKLVDPQRNHQLPPPPPSPSLEQLAAVLRREPGIGPTLTKVTTFP
eukprot:COSAG01_NODE_1105_length_11671_cov_3.526789_1_plen_467_part_00